MKFIPVREAKAKLSEILRNAKKEDIIITRWGKPEVLLQKFEEEGRNNKQHRWNNKIQERIRPTKDAPKFKPAEALREAINRQWS